MMLAKNIVVVSDQSTCTTFGVACGPPATSIPSATSSSWTPMDDLDHAAMRHRFGGKLGVDAPRRRRPTASDSRGEEIG